MDVIERIGSIMKLANGIEDHVVYDQLGDLRLEAFSLKEEILKLKEENLTLKQKLSNEEEKEYKNECYYFKGEGPFCSHCFDTKGLKIRTHPVDNQMGTVSNDCPECKTWVIDHTYPFEFQTTIKNVTGW